MAACVRVLPAEMAGSGHCQNIILKGSVDRKWDGDGEKNDYKLFGLNVQEVSWTKMGKVGEEQCVAGEMGVKSILDTLGLGRLLSQ